MNRTNPLLLTHEFPSFDRITPAVAQEAISALLKSAERDLTVFEQVVVSTWEGCMVPLLALSEPLDYAWSIISHMNSVMNTPEWRHTYEVLQPLIVSFSTRFGQSEPIYQATRQIRESEAWDGLDETQQRLIRAVMFNAESAGVGLPPDHRQRIGSLHETLAAASTAFSNNLLDATKAFALTLRNKNDVAGLPASLLATASATAVHAGHPESTSEKGPWIITLEASLFVPFMQFSTRRDLRETLYRAYVTRASDGAIDNTPQIERILESRRECAVLLNADSFASFTLRMRMAEDVKSVDRLIARLRMAARPAAEQEQVVLEKFACQSGQTEPLKPWDLSFWSERMRKDLFDFDDEDLRPYFQLPNVLDGLFDLAHRLFGITIRAADGLIPVWHSDVRFFEIRDTDDSVIAYFYLDPYSRPETKRGGAWMDAMRTRRHLPDGRILPPVAYLICNQTPPTGASPALMTLSEVNTLFHEFGHVIHHLLSTVEIPSAFGIHNVEWDAVELPSQFMENWCIQEAVLQRISRHVKTGDPLPAIMMEQIRSARTFRAGSAMLRQLLFAAVDIELHARYLPERDGTPHEFKDNVAKPYMILPPLPEDRFLCGFAHIFSGGYAAGYYSYKWAEVLSADAFAAFTEAGIDDPTALTATGRRFRNTVLALGGSRDPMSIFKAFRGREPDPDALLRQANLC